MTEENRKSFRNYSLGGCLLLLIFEIIRGGFTAAGINQGLLLWSDGFTVSGILLLFLIAGKLLNRGGYLDWAAYFLFQAKFLLRRMKPEEYVNFYDFRKLREHKGGPLTMGITTALLFLITGTALAFFVKY